MGLSYSVSYFSQQSNADEHRAGSSMKNIARSICLARQSIEEFQFFRSSVWSMPARPDLSIRFHNQIQCRVAHSGRWSDWTNKRHLVPALQSLNAEMQPKLFSRCERSHREVGNQQSHRCAATADSRLVAVSRLVAAKEFFGRRHLRRVLVGGVYLRREFRLRQIRRRIVGS